MRRDRDAHRERQTAATSRDRSAHSEREAADVRAARDAYRSEQAAKVAATRSDRRSEQSAVTAAKRAQWTAEQESRLAARRANYAEGATRELRRRTQTPGAAQDLIGRCGSQAAKWHGYGVGLGLGLGFSWCSPYGWYWNSYWNNCWPASGWWWNGWNNTSYWGVGWGIGAYPYSWWCHPLSFSYRCWWGSWPTWNRGWWPNAYAGYWGAAPVYYSNLLIDSSPSSADPVVIYVDGARDVTVYENGQPVGADDDAAVGEAVQLQARSSATSGGGAAAPAVGLQRGPDTLSRAANQHLAQADEAFRERRYADAVHFYAKAIEYRPNEGVMYLVLADALLATGDYHYGAFALRRALELDPSLASNDIDKHDFYANPAEFDEQLQLLERFLSDHPGDADARLLLAANYLFGRKPALTIDLLESGASASVRNEAAGKLILDAAKRARDAR